MLSTRGTLSIDAVFNEALGHAHAAHGGPRVLPITDAQNAWAAIGSFLHAQMLLGHAITIPKFCSFWTRQKHVATHGNLRYYVREVCFGFAQQFITTYNLDPMVPMEDLKLKYIKLPYDIISMEAKVPADVITSIINEITLFIGEGCFRGKSFFIEVPQVVSVQAKRERACVTPDDTLMKELFGIDSRKWPSGVREVAYAQVFRPRSSSSSSRATRSSSAAGGRPASSSAPQKDNRPMFVTALPQNKTFQEIESKPVTEIRHKPRLPGVKGRPQTGGTNAKHVDPLSASQMVAASALEEESVYDVLSPSRKEAAAMNAAGSRYQSMTANHHENDAYYMDDGEDDLPHVADPRLAATSSGWEALNPVPRIPIPLGDLTNTANSTLNTRQKTNLTTADNGSSASTIETPVGAPSCCKHIKAVFPWETALEGPASSSMATPRAPLFGRKRFTQENPKDSARSLLYDNMLQ